MIEIIPAIDIIDGRCVRLSQGDYSSKRVYGSTPVEMAGAYAAAGIRRLHLVDLDGAKAGEPRNLEVLRHIAGLGLLKIEWGGGIKSRAALDAVFDAGADFAIIGSVAVMEPRLMEEWLSEFGGDKIILGADVRAGKISVGGWLEDSDLSLDDIIMRFLPFGLKEVICTDISKDGMLQGPSDHLYVDLMKRYPSITFTVSGGVSGMDDIRRLSSLGLERVVAGKAIYENRISLDDLRKYIESAEHDIS